VAVAVTDIITPIVKPMAGRIRFIYVPETLGSAIN